MIDMSFVDLVLHDLINCGVNDNEIIIVAKYPTISMFIFIVKSCFH